MPMNRIHAIKVIVFVLQERGRSYMLIVKRFNVFSSRRSWNWLIS
jgi:hypothetical protein